ncbi:hypothetical protein ACFQZS_03090 [Mucilaginibacter calamicampi]|uniref:Uncharacterized protein n=1 Tax=Mucilaginibacter calamicampi TaxID=1302352 RepID=A0ABW2YRU7_9SPHI
MDYYALAPVSRLKTNELWIIQPKWYKANYELTDNVFVYAKIYTKGFWQGTTVFETTDEALSIKNLWNGGLEITRSDGSIVGTIERKLLSGHTKLILSDGSAFTYSAPSVWKGEYVWKDKFDNELIRLMFGSLSGKVPVTFNKRAVGIPYFSALVFIAFKLNLDNSEGG